MYNLVINLYAFVASIFSVFNKKARLMRLGQIQSNKILRKNIDRTAKYIWFHAASLGEFEQGRPMIEYIKDNYPEYKILLTFFSPSGYEVRKNYDKADVVCYLPFDTKQGAKRFVKYANPSMAIFIKYEFWSNYMHELKKANIPTYSISAIFRPEQYFFKWYGKLFRGVLDCFSHIFVQDERSKDLLHKIGIDRVSIVGDTRFDRVIDVRKQSREIPFIDLFIKGKDNKKHPVLVVGSSWPLDEEIFIPYFNKQTDLKLIIAPHEIHRSHLLCIGALLKRKYIRLSELNEENATDCDCIVVDSFGLLSSLYRYGDIAYIGGGFGAGIHNTLEAAVYGIPVIFGPKYGKFKEAKGLITSGGGCSINDASDFFVTMDSFLQNSEKLKKAGMSAGNFVYDLAGATEKIIREIEL